ncbi:10669_t:CDS:2 [Diversispora eburnea]|uniref:10669_t:CDS:1 n=1 Tax=Diversispora eburnea TaxID=1213867 RepID=A0A9N8W2Q7_9GLOM|nr:10669_t:CDS:2 [Diversispora eburnea]
MSTYSYSLVFDDVCYNKESDGDYVHNEADRMPDTSEPSSGKNSYESVIETTNNKEHSLNLQLYYPYIRSDHKLKRLRNPFPIFSNELNQFEDGKELTVKKLEILKHERNALIMEQQSKALELNKLYKERKMDLKNIINQNAMLRDQVEKIHGKLSGILNDLIGEERETGQLNPLTVGPFLLKLASKSAGQEI